MVTVLYGASPDPMRPFVPGLPDPLQPFVPSENDRFVRLAQSLGEHVPHRVRVSVLIEDGKTKLKVTVDGRLVSEVEALGSITIETDVGGAP